MPFACAPCTPGIPGEGNPNNVGPNTMARFEIDIEFSDSYCTTLYEVYVVSILALRYYSNAHSLV